MKFQSLGGFSEKMSHVHQRYKIKAITIRLLILLYSISFILISCKLTHDDPPYPPSSVISNISWNFARLRRLAPGSDLWPITWASDNNLYTSWGDGGGFNGTNLDGRVSLGFARIEGSPENFIGTNIWGGKNSEKPSLFGGKATGMLSVDGVLYAWLNMENNSDPDFRLTWSDDLGASWHLVPWVFRGSVFGENTFLNFGKDYAGARDGFVYVYGIRRISGTNSVELARVPKDQIKNRDSYEFFVGLTVTNVPLWHEDITKRQAIFKDPNGIGITNVIYNLGVNRYILTTTHGKWSEGMSRLGIFDAPEPWGPWTTVQYNENWGGYTGYSLGYKIPTKTPYWLSFDGKTMHLIFSGKGILDSFNLIKGRLTLNNSQPILHKEKD